MQRQLISRAITTMRHLRQLPPRSESYRSRIMPLIRDPIHGSLELHPLLIKIIKTPAFHRLKSIKQLSGLHYVYPGATHTRFEHSIGVAYLAGEYARMLKRRYAGEIEITDDDVLCVEIAGLCHDLGHGPFSHLFDGHLDRFGTSHEKLAQKILDEVIFKELKESKETDGDTKKFLTENNVERIKLMIYPKNYTAEDDKGRLFLYQIVANKSSGIDVDKWDYFIRDCHYMGLQHEFDYRRLMQMSRILEFDGRLQLCCNKREIPSIIGMFRTRCSLHEKGYKHRRGIAMNHMIDAAISGVLDIKLITTENEEELSIEDILGSLKTPDGLKGYLQLNDGILHVIENKKIESVEKEEDRQKLVKAKKMISKLHNDKYFTQIQTGSDVEKGPEVSVKDIVAKLKEESIEVNEEDIYFKKVKLSYGSEADANPCEKVLVYDEDFTKSEHDLKYIKDADIDPLFRPKSFGQEKFWYYYSEEVKGNKEDIKRVIVELHKQKTGLNSAKN